MRQNASANTRSTGIQTQGAQEPGDPRDVADASGASDCDDNTGKRLTKLLNRSECERKCSEQRDEEYLLKRAQDELLVYNPGSEMAVPGGVQSDPGRPESERNRHGGDTNPLCQDRGREPKPRVHDDADHEHSDID